MSERTRETAIEIVPGKLYQRGEFRNWSYEAKRRMFTRLGITDIVNLWGKIDPDCEGYGYHVWPELKSNAFPHELWTWVDLGLAPLLDKNHCLLVHCEAGRGRSVAVCAALLTHIYSGLDGEGALELMLNKVPGLKVHPALRLTLRERYGLRSGSAVGASSAAALSSAIGSSGPNG